MNYQYVLLKVLPLLPAVLMLPANTCAQTYPVKTVRIVVPFPAGAGADTTTRLFTPKLTEALAQQFIVDNRAGAAGNIGAEAVARATADGYTLLTAPASLASSRSLYKNLSFDLARDFEPAAMKLWAGRWRWSTPEAVVHPPDGGGRGVAGDENVRYAGQLDPAHLDPLGA